MKNRINESGRSMVEMLGVLAIIGVLSVMGIAGYTAAMKSYKENEIVAATSMCYMMGMAQNGGTGKVAMTYTPAPTGTSSIAFGTDNKVTITFSDTNLCAGVKAKFGDNAGDCSGNTLVVTLGDEEEETETTCNGILDLSGNCQSCPTSTYVNNISATECSKCPNTYHFGKGGYNMCISCNCTDSDECPPKSSGDCSN